MSSHGPVGDRDGAGTPGIGYVIPEFPSQTHIWIWREIVHMRAWGVSTPIFSTRRPGERDKARHAFASGAEAETTYLHPAGLVGAMVAMAWAVATRPLGLLRCIGLGFRLPVDARPRWRHVLPLVLPACVLARAARAKGVEHLHAHSCASSAVLCMMVRRLAGIPFSLTLNANLEWWGGAIAAKFRDAAFTISITEWLLEQVRRDVPGLPPDRCILGRIGVDTRKWRPGPGRDPAASDGTRIITVGRLHGSKGHDLLIRAVHRLVGAGRIVDLRLVGQGGKRPELEALVGELGLADRVTFLGSLSEDRIIEEMRDADLFVLASHAEPLGVVYMEAMAMEVAAIGTAAGGVGEIITSGVDGLLVPPRDAEALADAIGGLIDDPERRRELAEAGRRTIVERFDSRIGAATLFERILGRRPPALLVEEPAPA